MPGLNININGIDGEVQNKFYDDLLHPSLYKLGLFCADFPKRLKQWFKRNPTYTQNPENIDKFVDAVWDKLKNEPPENITPPEAYVIIPALQALSYSLDNDELRNMYADLLVASIKMSSKPYVHPAFIDIIKQLAPDEARILKVINQNTAMPLLNIVLSSPQGTGTTLIESNISHFLTRPEIECKEKISSMLINLDRLGLIDIKSSRLTEPTAYNKLLDLDNVKEYLAKEIGTYRYSTVQAYMRITDFGKAFCEICLPKK